MWSWYYILWHEYFQLPISDCILFGFFITKSAFFRICIQLHTSEHYSHEGMLPLFFQNSKYIYSRLRWFRTRLKEFHPDVYAYSQNNANMFITSQTITVFALAAKFTILTSDLNSAWSIWRGKYQQLSRILFSIEYVYVYYFTDVASSTLYYICASTATAVCLPSCSTHCATRWTLGHFYL